METAIFLGFVLLVVACAAIPWWWARNQAARGPVTRPQVGAPDSDLPAAAVALHEKGRAAGSRKRYADALSCFEQAMALAPQWPYPVYDLAFTYLLMGNADRALDYYRTVDSLAPRGFFTTRTAVYALEGEATGRFPAGTYLKYISREWAPDADAQAQLLDSVLAEAPDFAPALQTRALGLEAPEERLAALEEALAARPDPDTHFNLVTNRAVTLAHIGRKSEAVASLHELLADSSTESHLRPFAKLVLQQIETPSETPLG